MAFQSQQLSIKRLPLWLIAAWLAVAISWTSTCSVARATEPSSRVDGTAGKRAGGAQPAAHFSAPYTQLLRGAPIKAPVSFANGGAAATAKVQPTSWYRYGYPSYAYYRGYGGWYGPWYGRGAYGYYGSPYAGYYGSPFAGYYGSPYAGYWGGFYRPYGYYNNFSPYYASPYYVGYQPFGAYPFYTAAYYPPAMGLGYGGLGYGGFGPYGANYGGCCYW